MLRSIFVVVLLLVGWAFALRGPLEGLLLYLWIAYFRPEQWVWTNFFQTLPLSYTAGVYVVVRSLVAGSSFRFDLRVLLLVILAVHGGLSALLSDYSEYCFLYFRDFAKSLIISYLIAVLGSSIANLRAIILTIALSLSFEAAKQGWAQLVLNPGGTNQNTLPFLGDNNGVAIGMLMLTPLLVALGQTASKRWERWTHYFLAIGVLYRSISTYSRGGFLAAGALGLMFLWRSPYKFRALVAAVVAATITFSVLPQEYWDRMSTITSKPEGEREESSAGRLHFWQVAIRMADDHPIFGVGLNGYNPAYNRYHSSAGAHGESRSVHSVWFGVLSELGYGGAAIYLSTIGLAFLSCRRARRLAKRGAISKELGFFAIAVETALVVWAVGGTFVIFQYTEMLWHVVGLSMALNFLVSEQIEVRERQAVKPQAQGVQPGQAAALAFRR